MCWAFQTRKYALFASAPYMTTDASNYEEVWKNQIYLIFELIGEFTVCEQHTSQSRSDCVVETADYIYIFEFKVDRSADEALAQEKDYAGKYKADNRKIIKTGVNFSSEKKNIDEWKVVTDN